MGNTLGSAAGGSSCATAFRVKRYAFLVAAFVVGLFALLFIWPESTPQTGGLAVSFIGLTNDGAGSQLAQFKVANKLSRRVQFGVGEIQFKRTNGWPNYMRVANGAAWLSVKAGAERIFSVPVQPKEGVNWRVPLMYQEELSFIDDVRFRIDGLAWAIPHWRPGNPLPVRHGDPFHRTLYTCGPDMLGNEQTP